MAPSSQARICGTLPGLLGLLGALLGGVPAASSGEPVLPPPRYPVRSYGLDQGLTNLTIRSLASDATGYLWVGTEDGLFRYDGSRFQRFGREESLPSSVVLHLADAPGGGLWVGTDKGLARQEGQGFKAQDGGWGVPALAVNALAVDSSGCVRAANARGLFEACGPPPFHRMAGAPVEDVSALHLSRSGEVYAATGYRLHHRDAAGLWSAWDLEPENALDRVDAIVEDRQGRLWVRSYLRLWVREPGDTAFRRMELARPLSDGRAQLILDGRGTLWAPTLMGLAKRDSDASRWSLIGARQGLDSDELDAAFIDREGSPWVGVTGLGLQRIVGRGLWSGYTRREGLPSNVVWAILRDRDGQLWAGTDRGLARATAGGWDTLDVSHDRGINTVLQTPDGALWMGGVPAELIRWDPRTGQSLKLGASAGLRGEAIQHLQVTAGGRLWVATQRGGLLRSAGDVGAPGAIRFVREELPGGDSREQIRSLLLRRDGTLWAAGEHGLACRVGDRWLRFTPADGLRESHVAYLGDRTLLLIGDVTGHGVGAGMLTAVAKSCGDTLLRGGGDLEAGDFLAMLSDVVHDAARGRMVMTAFACIVDPRARQLSFANAGHNVPYYVEAAGGAPRLQALVGRSRYLGDAVGNRFEVRTRAYAPGDRLALFTDGVVECTNTSGEELGDRRFQRLLLRHAQAPLEVQFDAVLSELSTFFGAEPRADDLTLVLAEFLA